MSETISARQSILNYLTGEVLGSVSPQTEGSISIEPLPDGSKTIIPKEHRNSFHHDATTGLRIIRGTEPRFVFGTGILHPPRSEESNEDDGNKDSAGQGPEDVGVAVPPEFEISPAKLVGDSDTEPFGLERSQNQRPSAMGLSATVESTDATAVTFTIVATTYRPFDVAFEGESYSQRWWETYPA